MFSLFSTAFSIVWVVMLIKVITKIVRTKRDGIQNQSMQNPMNQWNPQQNVQNPNGQWGIRNSMQSAQPGQYHKNIPVKGRKTVGNTKASATMQPVQPVQQEIRPEESTTDYLARKAAADQEEHYKENIQTSARLDQMDGNMVPAQRYMEGEPIPQNTQKVTCKYCGADNVVRINIGQMYSCYFCREKL